MSGHVLRNERGDAICPDHGDSLDYHEDQGGEIEWREHLVCTEPGCRFEVWA